MRKTDLALFVACLAVYAALRGASLAGPFTLPFETAFQESIALHHLENGPLHNRFLPVFATIDSENFYHTAHPPLLHLAYWALYKVFGTAEAVTRLFSLALFAAGLLLVRATAGADMKAPAFFPAAFFLPAPFLLMTTTNYEPLSIFMVAVFGWCLLRYRPLKRAATAALTVGMLVDWPVYLAAPAALVLFRRDPGRRGFLLGLIAYEAVFFVLLQGYQYLVAGEAAFFSHAPNRANPLALLSADTYFELGDHFWSLTGAPASLVCGAAVIAFLAGLKTDRFSSPARATSFYGVYFLLLFLSAPQLVSRHYVYLLYLTPFLALCIARAASRVTRPAFLAAALSVLLLPGAYLLSQQRNPMYVGMVQSGEINPFVVKEAFSSSAVGVWKYYLGIETAYPMSAKAARWMATSRPDLIHLDGRGREVAGLRGLAGGDYRLLYRVSGEEVYLRKSGREAGWKRRPLVLDFGTGGPGRPEAGFVKTYKKCEHDYCPPFFVVVYSIRQPPGGKGSALIIRPAVDEKFGSSPALVHSISSARSDGVGFVAVTGYDNEKPGAARLSYARHLREGTEAKSFQALLEDGLALVTLPGPRMDGSFDDSYWLEPVLIKE